MFFSIIIPTYNRADFLDRCLDSLTRQSFKDFEVLICDDGSTDDSRVVAEAYTDRLNLHYLWDENWGGPAHPRNRGIAKACGEWICFLDSDDWWTEDKLQECFLRLNNADLLYHDMYIVRGSKHKLGQRKRLKGRNLRNRAFEDMLLNGNPIINSSVVIRRELIDRVGLISEDRELIAVEDFDYWLRIARMGARFKYVPKALGYYWLGGGNVSVGIKQFWRVSALMNKQCIGCDSHLVKRIWGRVRFTQGRILHLSGFPQRARTFYRAAFLSRIGLKAIACYWTSFRKH